MKSGFKKFLKLKAKGFMIMMVAVTAIYAVNTAIQNSDGLYDFKGGQVISASQIMANFNTLLNRIKKLEKSQVPEGSITGFWSGCPTNTYSDGSKVWLPADGQNGRPDLRGVFMRGLNNMGTGTSGLLGGGNPNGFDNTAKRFQNDTFQKHHHQFAYHFMTKTTSSDGIGDGFEDNGDDSTNKYPHNNMVGYLNAGGGTPRVSSETRPKNVSLYFCVKQPVPANE